MKGFFIEITNNLLESKHRRAMKESVWLFMWLLDKITSISEEGIGRVLGGKPITYEEVNKDLDFPPRTYKEWVSRLRKAGYINTIRAPRGLIFEVNKAKKVWKRGAKSRPSDSATSDGQKNVSDGQISASDGRKRDIQYKTVLLRNTKDNTKTDVSSSKKKPYFQGMQMRKKDGKWFVLPGDGGQWLEFAGREKDIQFV